MMDARPDTSSTSGRFRGQWSFLAHPSQNGQPLSLAPSSYIPHSDRSSVLPLPTGLHCQPADDSRSSLPRNLTTVSIGGRSSATIPSQPVLIRVHSADASAHTNPAPRPRRPVNMGKQSGLPAISEFSIQGILAAIQEDVEADINIISEILGKSRLVLADQHDSHMPPQGEIRAVPNSLPTVEEPSPSNERFMIDDVMILREDASLIDGSQAGSAAYGLLERLQALPRSSRIQPETPPSRGSISSPVRNALTPAVSSPEPELDSFSPQYSAQRNSTRLLQSSPSPQNTLRTSASVLSSHMLASAEGTNPRNAGPPTEFEPLWPIDEIGEMVNVDQISNSSVDVRRRTFRERMQNLLYVSDPTGLTAWLQGQTSQDDDHRSHTAEEQLRNILQK